MRRCWQVGWVWAAGWVWLWLPHMDHGKTSLLDFMRNTETGMAMGFMACWLLALMLARPR